MGSLLCSNQAFIDNIARSNNEPGTSSSHMIIIIIIDSSSGSERLHFIVPHKKSFK